MKQSNLLNKHYISICAMLLFIQSMIHALHAAAKCVGFFNDSPLHVAARHGASYRNVVFNGIISLLLFKVSE